MATIIGVGMQMTASAAGMTKGLSEADRALQLLQKIVDQNQQALGRLSGQAGKTTQQFGMLAKAANGIAEGPSLKFNELSGILSALPGPLGNVASRFSGLASAGEGLSRVLSGGISQGLSGIGGAVAALVNPFTAAVAAVAAFGAAAVSVANGLQQLEDRVENLGNIADKLGVSFEFIQTLEEAARRSGTSIDAVSGAFGRLQKSVLGVDEESKAARVALAELGITAAEIQQLSPEEQYQRIGSAIAAIEDPARRTATAVALFGKSGADLIPFFKSTATAAADIERYGRALTALDRQQIDGFGAALDKLSVASQGLSQSILLPFAGLAEGIATSLAEVVASVTKIADPILKIATPALSLMGEVIKANGKAIGDFARLVAQSYEQLNKVAQKGYELLGLVDANPVGVDESERRVKEAQARFDAIKERAQLVRDEAAKSQELIDKAIAKVGEYGQAGVDATLRYQQELRVIDDLVKEGEYTAEQAARARENATAQLDRELEAVKMVADEKKRAADAAEQAAKREADAVQSIIDKTLEQIRIERDFGGDAARARNAEDLQKVRDTIATLEAEIARANAVGDERNAKAAATRLAQFDQVEAKLAETEQKFLDAADQAAAGFADGFDKAFADTSRGLGELADKAAKFGDEGAKAWQQLQAGIERARAQVESQILNKPAYEAEIAAQRQLFEERIAQIEAVAQREAAARQANFDAQVAANGRLNDFMRSLMTDRERAEAQAAEENFKRRKEAAENLAEIEQRIALQRKAIEAAREQGEFNAAKARVAELRALEQLQEREKAIAAGKLDVNRQVNAAAEQNAAAQAALQQSFQTAAQQQIQASQTAATDAIGQINEAFAKAAEQQREKIREINTLGSRTVNTADVRTQEGAALVLGLAANAIDPRLVEQRLTNKILKQVATGLAGNLNRIGIPATLL